MPALALPSPVRKGTRYSAEELHAACAKAVEKAGISQTQLAALIDKSAGTVSRAMTDKSGRYGATQTLILSKLKGWTVTKHDPPPYWTRED